MPNVLEVQIVGDVSNLEKSLKKAESLQAEYTASIEKTSKELSENIAVSNSYKKAIEDLNKEYKNGAISSKDYSKQLTSLKRDEKETTIVTADLRKELSNLKREQKEVGGSFDTAAKKTANGGNALMQFSRIAQDAPYGIIGIGNNITAAVESFGHLQRSTGSAGGALKALAGSLIGSGGILLAISLLTTGLTVMAQKGISVGDVYDKLTGTFDEFGNSVKKASEEGQKSASTEIESLRSLVAVAQNDNIAKKDRLVAVDALQKQFPAYYGNLSAEKIMYGDLTDVTKEATKALIAKAVAEKLGDKASDVFLERLANQKKFNDAKKKIEEFDLKNGVQNLEKLTRAEEAALNSKEKLERQVATNILVEREGLLKKAEEERQSLIKTVGVYEKYTNIIDKLNETAAPLSQEVPVKIKPVTDKKDDQLYYTPIIKVDPIFIYPEAISKENKELLDVLEKSLSEDLKKLKTEGVKIDIPLQVVTESPSFEDYAKKLELAKEQTQIFADASGSAIGALAGELASNLETGNAAIDAFVGSVIQGLAQVAAAQLSGLIAKQAVAATSLTTDAAVATGNSVVAATETASASGPAAAFVLPALVGAAIGFIAAAFSGIKFAHGGIVPGGSFTGDKIPAMLNSGEAVMNQQQQANTLMAIANGNSNSLQGNRQSSNFTLETKLRGSDLLLGIKREERKR